MLQKVLTKIPPQLELPDLKPHEHDSSSLASRMEHIVNSTDGRYTPEQKKQIMLIAPMYCDMHTRQLSGELLTDSQINSLRGYSRIVHSIDPELFPPPIIRSRYSCIFVRRRRISIQIHHK